ncbi:hypothetical protein D9M71_432940 [compost metagenome]
MGGAFIANAKAPFALRLTAKNSGVNRHAVVFAYERLRGTGTTILIFNWSPLRDLEQEPHHHAELGRIRQRRRSRTRQRRQRRPCR